MFKCEHCDKEFETSKGLSGHVMGAHKRGDRTETKRKERVPVGVKQYKLKTNLREGKVGRWVNDRGTDSRGSLMGGTNTWKIRTQQKAVTV